MSQSADDLESAISSIESKASDYETATNFEAKKQEYLSDLSSVETSLGQLERRLERMEFLTGVLVEVLEKRDQAPDEVQNVRDRAESVADHDADYFYELVDESETDQYEQRIQQVQANAKDAIDTLEAELRNVESEWTQRVSAARNVQKLFGESRDMSRTFNEIESFVKRRMFDDSESVSSLRGEWRGLKKNWEQSGADWDTFQQEYELSHKTIDVLQTLAKGGNVELGELDETIASELLSVDDLDNVVKLTI